MTKQSKRYAFFTVVFVLTIAAAFFAFTSFINTNHTAIAAGGEVDSAKPVLVTSPGEAAAIAGYPIKTIANVPSGLESPKYFEIWETPDKAKATMQIWGSIEKDSFLLFIQDPSSAGIAGAEPYSVGSFQGQRLLLPADEAHGMPSRLALYWRDGNMTYQIFGTLAGVMDESTMVQLTKSISSY